MRTITLNLTNEPEYLHKVSDQKAEALGFISKHDFSLAWSKGDKKYYESTYKKLIPGTCKFNLLKIICCNTISE